MFSAPEIVCPRAVSALRLAVKIDRHRLFRDLAADGDDLLMGGVHGIGIKGRHVLEFGDEGCVEGAVEMEHVHADLELRDPRNVFRKLRQPSPCSARTGSSTSDLYFQQTM